MMHANVCVLIIITLGAGADVNAKNLSENTALHIASKYGHYDECVMLIKAGADMHARNKDDHLAGDLAGDERIKSIIPVTSEHFPPPVRKDVTPVAKKEEGSGGGKTPGRARRSSIMMIKVR
jgi:ankyrin repeat protein